MAYQMVMEPKEPVRDGYIFTGWYSDSGLTNIWNFSKDIVTKDLTLYAEWEEEEVTP